MKTIYHQRDNKRRRKKITITIGVVSAVLVFVGILSVTYPNALSPVVHIISRPFLSVRADTNNNVSFLSKFFSFKSTLIKENQDLKNTLTLYDAVKAERDFYKNENAELLKLVGRREQPATFLTARILTKPGFSPYDTVIIDGGQNEGVKVGQQVMANENNILGVVSQSYNHSAVVTLYSSPSQEVPVFIGENGVPAMATGRGGGNFEIKVPRNTEVNQGDIVIIASSTPKILGTIQHVGINPADSFEKILFKSTVDITRLTYVLIKVP